MCGVGATFLDLDTGGSSELYIRPIPPGYVITFSTTEDMDNRHYNVTIAASNSAGSAVSSIVLSKNV